jgi:hypothetical protein
MTVLFGANQLSYRHRSRIVRATAADTDSTTQFDIQTVGSSTHSHLPP